MPGTDVEYMGNPNTDRAVALIDSAVQQGQGGAQILEMLNMEGLRVYPTSDPGQEDGPPTEGIPIEDMEQPPLGGDELPPPEMAGPPPEEMMGSLEPQGSGDGGMREMRLAAVRFAMDKDKKGKSSKKDSEK
jgi:hypothetical protein